jgi:hypothetical protein
MAYYTDASRARLAVSALAADMADALTGMVAADQDAEVARQAGSDLIQAARRAQAQAADLVRLAVIHARQMGASWADVGADLGVSRQTAHERYIGAWSEWRAALPTGASLPDGAVNPSQAADRLDAWYAARNPGRGDEAISAGVAATSREADLETTQRHATREIESWGSLVPGGGRTPREYVAEALGEFADGFGDDAIDAITTEFAAAINAALDPDGISLHGKELLGPADVSTEDACAALANAIDAADLDQIIQRHDPS